MKKMGIAILFTVTFLCLLACSAFAVSWANVYDWPEDFLAFDIQPTSDGGVIVAGNMSNGGDGNVCVMKLTSTGSITWQKRYGGAGLDYVHVIRQTSDGGYIFAALTSSWGAGDRDAWIVKLNSTGAIQWQQAYGGVGRDWIYAIQETADGGFVLAGSTKSFSDSVNGDAWVAKVNSSGVTVWQKSYGSSNTFEGFRDIHEIPGGGFICAGVRESDAWVMRLTPTGNIKWQRSYGGSGIDDAKGVQPTSDGGFVVGASTSSFGPAGTDFWVFKLHNTGTILWQKVYSGPHYDALETIDSTSDGGYILTGATDSFGPPSHNFLVLKLDSLGGITWQKTYGGGGSEWPKAIRQTSDGNYVVAGRTFSFGATTYDALVLKLDSNGDIGFSCSLINSSSATVINSTAVTTIPTATSLTIGLKINITSAVPINISTRIVQIC